MRNLTDEFAALSAENKAKVLDAIDSMSDDAIEDLYDTMLDDVCPIVKIAGYEYDPSHALKMVDPVAYRCGRSDYIDSLLTDDILVEIGSQYYAYDDVLIAIDNLEV